MLELDEGRVLHKVVHRRYFAVFSHTEEGITWEGGRKYPYMIWSCSMHGEKQSGEEHIRIWGRRSGKRPRRKWKDGMVEALRSKAHEIGHNQRHAKERVSWFEVAMEDGRVNGFHVRIFLYFTFLRDWSGHPTQISNSILNLKRPSNQRTVMGEDRFIAAKSTLV